VPDGSSRPMILPGGSLALDHAPSSNTLILTDGQSQLFVARNPFRIIARVPAEAYTLYILSKLYGFYRAACNADAVL